MDQLFLLMIHSFCYYMSGIISIWKFFFYDKCLNKSFRNYRCYWLKLHSHRVLLLLYALQIIWIKKKPIIWEKHWQSETPMNLFQFQEQTGLQTSPDIHHLSVGHCSLICCLSELHTGNWPVCLCSLQLSHEHVSLLVAWTRINQYVIIFARLIFLMYDMIKTSLYKLIIN
jgi:hypothetical protein